MGVEACMKGFVDDAGLLEGVFSLLPGNGSVLKIDDHPSSVV